MKSRKGVLSVSLAVLVLALLVGVHQTDADARTPDASALLIQHNYS